MQFLPYIAIVTALLLTAIAGEIDNVGDVFQLTTHAYKPICAHACRISFVDSKLSCTDESTNHTSPSCYASDEPFLTSLALCLIEFCPTVQATALIEFWNKYAVGWRRQQPGPHMTFYTALQKGTTPSGIVQKSVSITGTQRVPSPLYQWSEDRLIRWNYAENLHAITA